MSSIVSCEAIYPLKRPIRGKELKINDPHVHQPTIARKFGYGTNRGVRKFTRDKDGSKSSNLSSWIIL